MAKLNEMISLYKAWLDLCKRAEDATYAGNSKELASAWYDIDMLRDQIQTELGMTPASLEQQVKTWQGIGA